MLRRLLSRITESPDDIIHYGSTVYYPNGRTERTPEVTRRDLSPRRNLSGR